MIKYCLLFFCFLFSCVNNPKGYSLNFKTVQKVDFETIKSISQKKNKPIFIDVYATWCGPCKYMDKTAFKDPELVKYFQANLINYKVDGEDFDGINIAQKYKVNSYPTYLFLNHDGSVLIRYVGSTDAHTLLNFAKKLD